MAPTSPEQTTAISHNPWARAAVERFKYGVVSAQTLHECWWEPRGLAFAILERWWRDKHTRRLGTADAVEAVILGTMSPYTAKPPWQTPR